MTGHALTTAEQQRCTELESVIDHGMQTFVAVGEALAEIRDSRLYRAGHQTFEEYCRERWGMDRTYAYRHIQAAGVAAVLPNGDSPQSEAAARELTPLSGDEEAIIAAWREAQDDAKAHGTRITAKIVKNAVRRRVERLAREADSEQRRGEPVAIPEQDADIRLLHGDFRDVFAAEDLAGAKIITDPPYPREHLGEWGALAEWGGIWDCSLLVAMAGQSILPEALHRISRDGVWKYRWCGAYLTTGPATRVWQAKVGTSWKPILVFDRGEERDFLTRDIFHPTGDDKRFHHWGQNADGIGQLVEAFTDPGDLVVDPFLGGGTTAVVCRDLGRRFVGCDIDADAVRTSVERLAA